MEHRLKVLIVLDDIHLGGISRSLLNYLPHISKVADCDLLIFNYSGLDQSLIPPEVTLLPTDERLHILGMSQAQIARYSKTMAAVRLALVLVSRVFGGDAARKLLFDRLPRLEGYDLAISFSQDVGWKTISTGCNHFVLDKVEAKFKAAFIHCDYERFGGYDPRQEAAFARFDKVVCVSDACRKSFVGKFPGLSEKTVVCENFTDTERVRRLAETEPVLYDDSKLNIVTVCRLGEEKGLFRAADAMKRLVDSGRTNFCWTVVGDGPEKGKLLDHLQNSGLMPYVELVGSKKNPYVYMKNADVFLLASYHEAAPMVFGECHALGLPVLSTETISARELVEERGLGIVCANSTEGIFEGLRDLMDSKHKPEKMTPGVMAQINVAAQEQMLRFLSSFGNMGKKESV